MKQNNRFRLILSENRVAIAHMVAILTVIIWGTTFVSTKVLLRQLDPIQILIYRFTIGYLVLVILHPRPLSFQGWKQEGFFVLSGLSGVTLYFLCENIALTYTLAGNVGIIVSTAPIFTALLAFFFLKEEKLKVNFFIGFLVAIVGIYCISANGVQKLQLNPRGDMLAIGAAVIWAVYSIVMKKYVQHTGSVLAVTRRTFFYGLVTMIPCAYAMGFRADMAPLRSMTNLLNLVYLGLGASAACYLTWNYALKVLGALKTSLYIYIVPVITLIASAIILKEPFTLAVAAGVMLTVGGLLISAKK